MTIRHTCVFLVMASGLLIWTGGTVFAEQSMTGDQHRSDQSKGDKPGSAGGDSLKSGQSVKTGVETYGQTGAPKACGEATLDGSGRMPDSSTTNCPTWAQVQAAWGLAELVVSNLVGLTGSEERVV